MNHNAPKKDASALRGKFYCFTFVELAELRAVHLAVAAAVLLPAEDLGQPIRVQKLHEPQRRAHEL